MGGAMKILIADDHELVSEMLRMRLERDGGVEVVATKNFDEAYAVVGTRKAGEKNGFDLILLDMRMPGMNGLSGLRRIRQLVGTVPVGIISGQLTPAEARQVMAEGAAGFLPKTLPVNEMVEAIRKMVAGERYVHGFLMVGEGNLNVAKPVDAVKGLETLTPRERECLMELTHGWTNKQIAQNLGVTEVTVKTHLIAGFRKIGAKNRTDAVRIALSLMNERAPAEIAS
jgi:two-component system nitrate/nitrite response regulator NarL